MFALARTADIVRNDRRVRKVPLSDSLRQKRPLDHLVARGEMLRVGRLDDVGTRATAARPTVLPIRILQLFPVAHLVYVLTMPRAENPPGGREHLEFDC
jgi:hypothetical protein